MSDLDQMILDNFTAMEDERKEACIHCGNIWYSIHYRDGVCHSCQQLEKPGRSILARRKKIASTIKKILLFASVIIVSGLYWHHH